MKRLCYFKLDWISKFSVGVMIYVFLWDWVERLAVLCINTELIIKMIKSLWKQMDTKRKPNREVKDYTVFGQKIPKDYCCFTCHMQSCTLTNVLLGWLKHHQNSDTDRRLFFFFLRAQKTSRLYCKDENWLLLRSHYNYCYSLSLYILVAAMVRQLEPLPTPRGHFCWIF